MEPDLCDPTRGSSEPNRLWSTTNAGEAVTDVMSPLCWSFWKVLAELGGRDALYDLGLLRRTELNPGDDQNRSITGCFYGRFALNVDVIRSIWGRLPGSFADDFERDLFGMVRPDAPPVSPSCRTAATAALKAPRVVALHSLATQRLRRRQLTWWRQTAFASPAKPVELLAEAALHFRQSMRIHMHSRMIAHSLYPAVERFTKMADRGDLFLHVIAGLGGLEEIIMGQALWDVAHGRASREQFIQLYGYHGLNEGNLTGRSWRQDPAALEPLIAEYRDQSAKWEPREQANRSRQAHEQAMRGLLAALPRSKRPAARATIRLLSQQVRLLQQTKACFLMSVDVARNAADGIGRRLTETGLLDHPEDAYYLTLDELRSGLPEGVHELVARRRVRHTDYRALRLPARFTGIPQPVQTLRADERKSSTTTGIGAASGTAHGRIRLILNLNEAHLFQKGEILLCPATDPSWAVLFALAKAAIIDVGGMASHGAIVAREFGIPCVIGTGDGTRRFQTGDTVRVDGTTGTVQLLSPASPHTLQQK